MVSALSDAELAVLRLIREDLSVREMAARLYVSENTVRTHRRALYRKLGVHSRDEAVARAQALELLTTRHQPVDAPPGESPPRLGYPAVGWAFSTILRTLS